MSSERNRKSRSRDGAEHRIAAVATEQGGPVALDQLRAAGVSDRSASHRSAKGSLHRIHRGVYAVGHLSLDRRARLKAALLACGEGAMISHLTAAALWGLCDDWPALIDVTVPCEAGRKIDGIRCRRCRYPNPEEITAREGIACTTPARVFVDLTGDHGVAFLRRTVARAAMLKMLDVDAADLAIHNGKGRRGLRSLDAVIAPWRTEDGSRPDLRSDFEALVLPRLIESGLPRPACNAPLLIDDEALVVDFLWPDRCLIVETDGRQTHETPAAFQEDRRRDQILLAAGYRVLRVTWTQIHSEPHDVITRVKKALDHAVP